MKTRSMKSPHISKRHAAIRRPGNDNSRNENDKQGNMGWEACMCATTSAIATHHLTTFKSLMSIFSPGCYYLFWFASCYAFLYSFLMRSAWPSAHLATISVRCLCLYAPFEIDSDLTRILIKLSQREMGYCLSEHSKSQISTPDRVISER